MPIHSLRSNHPIASERTEINRLPAQFSRLQYMSGMKRIRESALAKKAMQALTEAVAKVVEEHGRHGIHCGVMAGLCLFPL
jgi:hypothetical protein